MSTNNGTSGGGIGFCGMLAILFIGLKLTHYIDWSWWWVLSPIWIPLSIVLVVLVVVLAAFLITYLMEKRQPKINRTAKAINLTKEQDTRRKFFKYF